MLAMSMEVLYAMRNRIRRPRYIFMVRDPLEWLISWLQSGASWNTPWDDQIHFGSGFFVEHMNLAMQALETEDVLLVNF